jgi:hypothetical protein
MTDSTSDLTVTLSAELFRVVQCEAKRLGLPIEWVIASLVADTIEIGATTPSWVAA